MQELIDQLGTDYLIAMLESWIELEYKLETASSWYDFVATYTAQ